MTVAKIVAFKNCQMWNQYCDAEIPMHSINAYYNKTLQLTRKPSHLQTEEAKGNQLHK